MAVQESFVEKDMCNNVDDCALHTQACNYGGVLGDQTPALFLKRAKVPFFYGNFTWKRKSYSDDGVMLSQSQTKNHVAVV